MPPTLQLEHPKTGTLKSCIPNLMPFRIEYSGPAPVSLYFLPKPAPSRVGAPSGEKEDAEAEKIKEGEPAPATANAAATSTADVAVTAAAITADAAEPPAASDLPNDASMEAVEKIVDSTNIEMEVDTDADTGTSQDTIAVDVSQESAMTIGGGSTDTLIDSSSGSMPSIPPSTGSTAMASPSGDASQATQSELSNTRLTRSDDSRRFIATFRGRIVQGLDVALPEGYSGVVLKTKNKNNSDANGSAEAEKSREERKKPSRSNGKRRNTRSSKPIDVDEEEDEATAMNVDDVDLLDVKKLQIDATFSSLMIWHPDNPVNEGMDEYARALKEWTHLASVIHAVDDDDDDNE